MTSSPTPQPLSSGGLLWGPERMRLGISIRTLARLSGVGKGVLSRCEHGRMIPTPDEFGRVMAALREVEAEIGTDKLGQLR